VTGMGRRLALDAFALRGTPRVPCFEVLEHPALIREVTGIDPFTRPLEAWPRACEALAIDWIVDIPRTTWRFDPGEEVRDLGGGRRVTEWGCSGSLWAEEEGFARTSCVVKVVAPAVALRTIGTSPSVVPAGRGLPSDVPAPLPEPSLRTPYARNRLVPPLRVIRAQPCSAPARERTRSSCRHSPGPRTTSTGAPAASPVSPSKSWTERRAGEPGSESDGGTSTRARFEREVESSLSPTTTAPAEHGTSVAPAGPQFLPGRARALAEVVH